MNPPRGILFPISFVLAASLLALPASSLRGATLSVPFDYSTIQEAIDAASPGDEILVEPGTWMENIDFKGKAINVRSRHGAADTIIDGGQTGSVVSFTSGEGTDTLLEGFSLINGTGTEGLWNNYLGGGIYCVDSSPTIRGCIVTANTANDGGAIFCGSGSPTITGNRIVENSAFKGGAIYLNDHADATIVNNMIACNEASSHGGGICCWNNVSAAITNNTLVGNSATDGGGIYCVINCSLVVTNTILWDNKAFEGPEIWVGHAPSGSTLSISYSNVQQGLAGTWVDLGCTLNWGDGMIDADPFVADPAGGDLHLTSGSPCVDAGTNSAPSLPVVDFDGDPRIMTGTVDMGGDERAPVAFIVPDDMPAIQDAIDAANDGDVIVVKPGTYVENIDFTGKAIVLRSSGGAEATVIDGTQSGSVVTFSSGEGANSVIEGFRLFNGTGTKGMWNNTYLGGGIYCNGASPTIRNNMIENCTAMMGGGIFCRNGSPRIARNTIAGNSVFKGGGIYLCDFSNPLVVNNMIFGNDAYGHGGGICCWNNSAPMITNNTLYKNSAYDGGGLYLAVSCTPRVTNSILWGNKGVDGRAVWIGIDAHPSVLTISYCDVEGGQDLVHVEAGCTLEWGAGMIALFPSFTNPGAGDLSLSAGSPCRNRGDNSAPAIPDEDHGGGVRIAYGTVDLGADEFYSGSTLFVPTGYLTIQAAIDAAVAGDEIVVAAGTYLENISFRRKAIKIFSEEGPGVTVIDGGYSGSTVTFINGEGEDSWLEGFTVTGGRASVGAGIYCVDSSPTIRRNEIRSNEADSTGGGLYCGGVAFPLVEENLFKGNKADRGGAIACSRSSPDIVGNEISANGITIFGGGIWCGQSATPSIRSNKIKGNQNSGIWCEDSAPTINGNIISNNTHFGNGGGIYVENSAAQIGVNAIAGNAAYLGGGIYCIDCNPVLTGNTFADNWAFTAGGGLYCSSASPAIANSIFWGDSAPSGPEIYVESGAPLVTYSDVEGGWAGPGNIDADPLLANVPKGDFHIVWGSPCKNAGNNAALGISSEDFDLNPRIVNGTVDMGADEFHLHLYYTGIAAPEGNIDIRIAGQPYTSPVTLFLGEGVEEDPTETQFGTLYLTWPPMAEFPLGQIPADGILVFSTGLPLNWEAGDIYPLQALAGPQSNPASELTNLMEIFIRE